MKKILLACSSGMSTSLLVTKMKNYAQSLDDEVEIWAVSQEKAKSEMKKADAVLMGPQLIFLKDEFQKEAQQYGIHVDVIDRLSYGKADGKTAYELAVNLINKNSFRLGGRRND